ncbi:MAG: O-antigen ligase family protein [Steroidobacteraceae bacterium]
MSLTTIAVIALFLSGSMLALARHPIYGLMTYVAFFYLSPPDRWWGQGLLAEIRWSLSAAVVTLIALLIHSAKLPSRPFADKSLMIGLILFAGWIGLQSIWAVDAPMHADLFSMYAKFPIVLYMIWRCIDSDRHLKYFLGMHVLGCLYFAWIAYTTYQGGRFEGFGGPGLDDANAGALALVTGLMVAAALFFGVSKIEKVVMFLSVPLILNAIVATISRSGFLAILVGGTVFNAVVPRKFRGVVRVSSVAGIVLLLMLTTNAYWDRIASIKYAGADIEDVDTGGGRVEQIQAQWRMFKDHPMGCGHRCTADLSRFYLEERFLDASGARSSHNTMMTILVEQGVPGILLYFGLLAWLIRRLLTARRLFRDADSFPAIVFPGVAAALCAIFIGDFFVDYLKFELRFWFLTLLAVLVAMGRVAPGKEPALGSGRVPVRPKKQV